MSMLLALPQRGQLPVRKAHGLGLAQDGHELRVVHGQVALQADVFEHPSKSTMSLNWRMNQGSMAEAAKISSSEMPDRMASRSW
jgi:hypothetical protein